jgi:hypothetical protein
MKVAIPIRGLGNPKRAACSLSITDLQEMKLATSQASLSVGLAATLNLSRVSRNEANQPVIPARISRTAKPLEASVVGDLAWFSLLMA